MGNNRFRIWDMIPNAWLNKQKRLSKSSSSTNNNNKKIQQAAAIPSPSPASSLICPSSSSPSPSSSNNTGHRPHFSHQRKSYYFTRDPTDPSSIPPAASAPGYYYERKRVTSRLPKPRKNRPSHRSTSVSNGCSCRASATVVSSVRTKPEATDSTTPDHAQPDSDSCSEEEESIIPEFYFCTSPETYYYSSLSSGPKISNKLNDKQPPYSVSSGLHLRPITTTNIPAKFRGTATKEDRKLARNNNRSGAAADASCGRVTNGLRLRTNSPRMGNRLITHHHLHDEARKGFSRRRNGRSSSSGSLGESFAVVKWSEDPGRDFRESMVEMIVENDIRAPKDLEDLLACYLSLNSDQYHDLIIAVFRQIWFDLAVIHERTS